VPKIWAAIRKAIGMEGVRLHDLRHTFASVAATSGESLLMIKAILGHKDQATTQRYAHLQDDPVKAVADRTSATIAAAMLGKPNSKAPN
jgi:integrase